MKHMLRQILQYIHCIGRILINGMYLIFIYYSTIYIYIFENCMSFRKIIHNFSDKYVLLCNILLEASK